MAESYVNVSDIEFLVVVSKVPFYTAAVCVWRGARGRARRRVPGSAFRTTTFQDVQDEQRS